MFYKYFFLILTSIFYNMVEATLTLGHTRFKQWAEI